MKTIIQVFVCILVTATLGSAQTTNNFRFDIDGEAFFRIRTNINGQHLFYQHNDQSSMFFGYNSGQFNITDVPGDTNGGEFNTAFGFNTLSQNIDGQRNTAIGYAVLDENISGDNNVGLGYASLSNNETGFSNIAIGSISLRDNVDGNQNVAVGDGTLTNATGTGSTAVGTFAGTLDGASSFNVYLGYRAGRGPVTNPITTYNRNDNVMIGAFSGDNCTSSDNVFIGKGAGTDVTINNQLYITNSNKDETEALIYGDFGTEDLRLNAELNIDGKYIMPTTSPSTGQVLRANSSGANATIGWANISSSPWNSGSGGDIFYNSGDVGIGENNPSVKLDLIDDTPGFLAHFINKNDGDSDGLIIQAGKADKPTTLTSYIDFKETSGTTVGNITGDGTGGVLYNTTSDRRLKQNISTYEDGLKTLMQIRPAIYERKINPGVDEIGFIAQELKEIVPGIVAGDESGDVTTAPMTVDYGKLTPVLVAALQEQQEIIEELKKQLETQYGTLKAEIEQLKGVAEK